MKTEKKFKLREDLTMSYNGHKLYRIELLRDFRNLNKGDLGGWVEKEENLSQKGNCWIYHEAMVYGDARVCGNAIVTGYAQIYDNAKIFDDVTVYDNVKVFGNAKIFDNVILSDNAQIFENASLHDYAQVYENAMIYSHALITDNVLVFGNSVIKTSVKGKAVICGNVEINEMSDYYVGKNIWSSGRYFTYTRPNKMWKVGCFYGTSEELIKKAYEDSELSGRNYERIVKYVEETYNDIESCKGC